MGLSRQEWFAWTTLLTNGALLAYYLISVFGLEVGESVTDLLIQVFLVATVVEMIVQATKRSKAGRVEKDERDRLIEGYGFRNGYYFFTAALAILVWHLGVQVFFVDLVAGDPLSTVPKYVFHYLVSTVLTAGIVSAGTRLFLYGRGV